WNSGRHQRADKSQFLRLSLHGKDGSTRFCIRSTSLGDRALFHRLAVRMLHDRPRAPALWEFPASPETPSGIRAALRLPEQHGGSALRTVRRRIRRLLGRGVRNERLCPKGMPAEAMTVVNPSG